MKKLLLIFLLCVFSGVSLGAADIAVSNLTHLHTLGDSLLFVSSYRTSAVNYTRLFSYWALKRALADTGLTYTKNNSTGLRLGLNVIKRWHLNSNVVDGTTMSLNTTSNAIQIKTDGIDSTRMKVNSIPSDRIVDNYPGVYITPTFYWNSTNDTVKWDAGYVIRGTLTTESNNWTAYIAGSQAVGEAELLAMNITDGTIAKRAWNSATNKYTRGNKYRVLAYHYGGLHTIAQELDSKTYQRHADLFNAAYHKYESTYITPVFYWNYNYTKVCWQAGTVIRTGADWTAFGADSVAIATSQILVMNDSSATLAVYDWNGGSTPFLNSTRNKQKVVAYVLGGNRYIDPSLNHDIGDQYNTHYNRYESVFISPSFYRTGHTGNTIKWDDIWIVGKDPTIHAWTKIDADGTGITLSADYTLLAIDLYAGTVIVKQWNADTTPYIRDPRYRVIAFHITSTNTVIVPAYENLDWRESVDDAIEGLTALTGGQWDGDSLVWLGTSIPAGADYPSIVCSNVGAILVNLSQGSSHVKTQLDTSIKNYSGDWTASLSQLSETIAEKQFAIDSFAVIRPLLQNNPPTVSAMAADSGGIQTTIKNWSYEYLIKSYVDTADAAFISKADLIVFDHGYNDAPDSSVYTLAELINSRDSWRTGYADSVAASRNRKNYISAMNYILDKIYEKDPYQRILLIGHYYNYANQWLIPTQEELAEYWQIPICLVHKKMNFTDQKVTGSQAFWAISPWSLYTAGQNTGEDMTQENVYIPDRVHLHTDPNCRADSLVAKVITSFVKEVF